MTYLLWLRWGRRGDHSKRQTWPVGCTASGTAAHHLQPPNQANATSPPQLQTYTTHRYTHPCLPIPGTQGHSSNKTIIIECSSKELLPQLPWTSPKYPNLYLFCILCTFLHTGIQVAYPEENQLQQSSSELPTHEYTCQ